MMSKITLDEPVLYTANDDWLDSFADSTQEDASDDDFACEDWRLGVMNEGLRALIVARFGGSVDYAMLKAEKLVHLYARPPQWALDLWDIRRTQLDHAQRIH